MEGRKSFGEEATTGRRRTAPVTGRVVGIDAAGKYGWIGIVLDADGFKAARLGSLARSSTGPSRSMPSGWTSSIGTPTPVSRSDGLRRQRVGVHRRCARWGSDARVFEIHPEVSFRELAGECLAWSKKSWNGLLLRRLLLSGAGVMLPDVIPDVAGAVADDIVDAAVVAWSARRIASGTARSFPDPPEESGDRRVAIWC